MIQTLGQRLQGIRNSGVQAVLVASFNRTFAGLSVGAFVENILVSTLDARIVVVGEDFRFGRNRRGGVENLRSWGKRCGFKVHSIPAVVKSGRAVSSSLIRRLLLSGRVDRAQVYLGRPYEIVGRVVRGAARGRSLGFPTANLRTDNEILPEGVFVTIAAINGEEYPAVTNIGFRPTFGCDSLHIETFLLDRREILYRRTVRLRFLKKLRPERTFSTAGALVEQIQMDIAAARGFFQASGH